MTDTTASSGSSETQETRSPEQPGVPIYPSQTDAGWESVTFPGQMPLTTISEAESPGIEGSGAEAEAVSRGAEPGPQAVAYDAQPEPAPEDLVQLIQDLNQCNDALLLRVSELEEDLERSQVALQAEVERNQAPANPAALPMGAQPGPVQQQIAQLLSELDVANDGLRRTTIHNETLQAELDVAQQRVAQLERECTLLQQRFGDKNTALHQAEETCRDLKARLHRQQRYTLQFKAALEKCLNMTPASSSVSGAAPVPLAVSAAEPDNQPVTMPRSQQIQPWSAGKASLDDNPSLTHLLRGLRGASPATLVEPTPVEVQPDLFAVSELSSSRFVEMSVLEVEPQPRVTVGPTTPPKQAPEASLEPAPKASLEQVPEVVPAAIDPWVEVASTPASDSTTAASLFTEPSPWGEPVASAPPADVPMPEPLPIPPLVTAPLPAAAPTTAAAPTLPADLTADAKVVPSPLVYPLRSQKKIKSIAAVELPSFGRTVRRR
ncbi:hypothetical protein [Nodosilinea sp. E11]|uniref:hypothetical protein n=1 Tax=Nodosilinea sp. E11 TaxID=3037479 RepID=UPI0029342D60|nr:hypothetical protein [Nodosilinea sp. E11]WOD37813.1 hypothetical protein RRF56_16500 [Nodosilinea sp. E11]